MTQSFCVCSISISIAKTISSHAIRQLGIYII